MRMFISMRSGLCQCLGPTYTGDFHLRGASLRARGLNRVGNLLVPNSNYCAFEDWVMPILDAMKAEQDAQPGVRWTPSKVRVGTLHAPGLAMQQGCQWDWQDAHKLDVSAMACAASTCDNLSSLDALVLP